MILTYTNSEKLNKMLPEFSFLNIDLIKTKISEASDDIEFSDVLIDEYCDLLDRITFVYFLDDKIVGILNIAYNETGFDYVPEYKYGCTFVSTHKDYSNRGIGTELIEKMFSFSSEAGIDLIKQSFYKVNFIRKTFIRVSEKYKNVKLIDAYEFC